MAIFFRKAGVTGRGLAAGSLEGPVKQRLEALIVEMIESGIRLDMAQREFERKYLKIALRMSRDNRLATARRLGIHRNTLHHKLAKHKIQ